MSPVVGDMGCEDLTRISHGGYLAQKCSSEDPLNRSAALSGVISRCGIPSISNPTINFLTVADLSSGG